MADLEVLPHEPDDGEPTVDREYSKILDDIGENYDAPVADHLTTLVKLIHDRAGGQVFEEYPTGDLLGYLNFIRRQFDQYQPADETYRLTIINPKRDEHGWESPYTHINLVIDDLPFVVDSLHELLKKKEHRIRHSLFSPLHTEWDEEQLSVLEDRQGDNQTFFINLQIERCSPDEIEELRNQIETFLSDLKLAVEDFDPMLDKARSVSETIDDYSSILTEDQELLGEAREFIEYLIDGNFVFLGFREYNLFDRNGQEVLEIDHGSGLGILRREESSSFYDPKPLDELNEQLQKRITSGFVLIVTKANSESRVYRRERLDYIGIKKLDADGEIIGEYRFLGLFTDRVMAEPAVNIPLLKQKFQDLIDRENIEEHTHTYRDVYSVYNSMPKHLLFMSPINDLIDDINTVIGSHGDTTFKLRARPDIYQRGMSLMILMSKDRFNQYIRKEIQAVLKDEFEPQAIDYRLSLGQGDQARLHFYLQTDRRSPKSCSFDELEHRLFEITRTWFDNLSEEIRAEYDQSRAETLRRRYENSFPDEYQYLVEPSLALRDIQNLEELHQTKDGPIVDLVNPTDSEISHLIFYDEEKIRLSDIMPLISNHGLSVIEQTTVEVSVEETSYHLHLFRIQDPNNNPVSESRREILLESIHLVHGDIYRDDILNELVTREGLSARTLNLFRLYKNYFHQLQPAIKLESINRSLINHSPISSDLFKLFETKFDPTLEVNDRDEAIEDVRSEIRSKLDDVSERNQYQILRSILNQIESTVRTNYYQNDGTKEYISVKIDCHEIESMPEPRPLYEIFVYSPLMEAIHLRGGEIARGGIRWSDRRDDFRTEVLDLMKTQMVKNSLIVPVGSKGGFVLKTEHLQGKELRDHAKEQYKVFMRGMLDLTDNLVDDETVHPDDVICYDGEDPYLVVAADKGTAHLSDTANEVAREYDFWLDDAFASGGSVGYDHKELGITAKGAWESVKRHFRELGQDIQNQPFTVAGIGDMGGDVFGNGLILSDQIKLLAAFNHRHIFIDPEPDPAASFEERKRLFEDGAGWDQYDTSLISEGGGIYERDSKAIELSQQARNMLDLEEGEQPNGENLIQAILKMEADLLWNGGIGTYIKSSEEAHSEVGDPPNDDCRVNADQVQFNVIGEGGNLGITQEGRIELNRQGVRLNTDAIDNSGGVDLSDHEVNLKIALKESIKAGELDEQNREDLLLSLTDQVVDEVTHHNYEQSGAISLENMDSENRMEDFRHLLDVLEDSVGLNRDVEELPNERALQKRIQAGDGMTRPELSVLLSYSKMDLFQRSLEENWSERNVIKPFLYRYFPDQILDEYPEGVENHPLRKEIAVTSMINYVVDHAGFSFLYRLEEELAADVVDILGWYLTADKISGSQALREQIFELDNEISSDYQYLAWQRVRDTLGNVTSWLYDAARPNYTPDEFLNNFQDSLEEKLNTVLEYLDGERKQLIKHHQSKWEKRGFPDEFTDHLSNMSYLIPTLDILLVHDDTEHDFEKVAKRYFRLGSALSIDWLMHEIRVAHPQERWDQFAYQNLSLEINEIQRILTRRLLDEGIDPDTFLERNPRTAQRLEEIKEELDRDRDQVFSAYQFMVQRIKNLV